MYTAEFKELVVKRVKDGKSMSAVAKAVGLIEHTLRNWVKALGVGTLNHKGATGMHSIRAILDGTRDPQVLASYRVPLQSLAGDHCPST